MSTNSADTAAIQSATRVVLRPIATPLPLGFLALEAGTLLVSGLQLKWLGPDMGQHNEEIYRGRLGLSAEEIDRLKRDGII